MGVLGDDAACAGDGHRRAHRRRAHRRPQTTPSPSSSPPLAVATLDAPLHQLGVQFLQIGRNAATTAALRDLDDALTAIHGVRDLVDTTPYADDAGSCSRRSSASSITGSTGCGRLFLVYYHHHSHPAQTLYTSSC
jgi:hypothetical protein